MNKKDYKAIANVIVQSYQETPSESPKSVSLDILIDRLSEMLFGDNSNFNKLKFKEYIDVKLGIR